MCASLTFILCLWTVQTKNCSKNIDKANYPYPYWNSWDSLAKTSGAFIIYLIIFCAICSTVQNSQATALTVLTS